MQLAKFAQKLNNIFLERNLVDDVLIDNANCFHLEFLKKLKCGIAIIYLWLHTNLVVRGSWEEITKKIKRLTKTRIFRY